MKNHFKRESNSQIQSKSKYIFVLVCCFALLSPLACQQESIQLADSQNLTKLPEIIGKGEILLWQGVPLPENTVIVKKNVGSMNSAEFVFPKGIKAVIQKPDNSLSLESGDCYQCTSDCQNGCDVVKLGDAVGCSRCEGDAPPPCTGKSCLSVGYVAGFIDINVGIIFIKKGDIDKISSLASPNWDILEKLPEVQSALETLNLKYYGTKSPSQEVEEAERKGYLINLFGSPAIYYIPNTYFKSLPQTRVEEFDELEESGVADVTCKCESGTTGCTKEKIRSMGVTVGYKCVSGSCTTCKMTW